MPLLGDFVTFWAFQYIERAQMPFECPNGTHTLTRRLRTIEGGFSVERAQCRATKKADIDNSIDPNNAVGRRVFGSNEAQDLPKLKEEDQFQRIIYIDWVEQRRSGNGLYTGSATGELGGASRCYTYEKVRMNSNSEKRVGLHPRTALEAGTIMRLRPLMIFDNDVSPSLTLLLEGLTMEFLVAIDRASVGTTQMGNNVILHHAAILNSSIQAFPSKRQAPDSKGLKFVSALEQTSKLKLPDGVCPFDTFYCN